MIQSLNLSGKETVLNLTAEEVVQVLTLVEEIVQKHPNPAELPLLDRAEFYAHSLPPRLRHFLLDFKCHEPSDGYCIVSGLTIDDVALGPTPSHWKFVHGIPSTSVPTVFLILVAAVLGDIFSWATKQNGALITDILPIAADAMKQLSSGSQEELAWHTEDSFHPNRADYLLLLCLRNPNAVGTTVSSIGNVELSQSDLDLLLEDNFIIAPDISHGKENNPAPFGSPALSDVDELFSGIQKIADDRPYMSVLFGARDKPYLRIDPIYMGQSRTPEAHAALDRLIAALQKQLRPVSLEPGQLLIVNNYMAVHGREAFDAKFDGTDRWLRRVSVTNDIRKSRDRQLPGTRLLR